MVLHWLITLRLTHIRDSSLIFSKLIIHVVIRYGCRRFKGYIWKICMVIWDKTLFHIHFPCKQWCVTLCPSSAKMHPPKLDFIYFGIVQVKCTDKYWYRLVFSVARSDFLYVRMPIGNINSHQETLILYFPWRKVLTVIFSGVLWFRGQKINIAALSLR